VLEHLPLPAASKVAEAVDFLAVRIQPSCGGSSLTMAYREVIPLVANTRRGSNFIAIGR